MGVWNSEILGNDTTADIYANFFEIFNSGAGQIYASDIIKKDFADYFEDYEDKNNSYFGLALAQWETKSLQPEIHNEVKNLIENGIDIKLWEELGADEETLKERKDKLNKFLEQISTERPKAKRRLKPKFDFTTNELVKILTSDGTKEFRINEEFNNGKYIHTSGIIEWNTGGGAGILYFEGQGKKISAEFKDNNKLIVKHDINLNFTKKESRSYFSGNGVEIEYIAE